MGSVNLCLHVISPDLCCNAKQNPSKVPNNTEPDDECKQPDALILPLLPLIFQISPPF